MANTVTTDIVDFVVIIDIINIENITNLIEIIGIKLIIITNHHFIDEIIRINHILAEQTIMIIIVDHDHDLDHKHDLIETVIDMHDQLVIIIVAVITI